jgi:hypothetical protein
VESLQLNGPNGLHIDNNNTTSPFGGLDGIESEDSNYYVTDNPAGKVYVVNANGTGYVAL